MNVRIHSSLLVALLLASSMVMSLIATPLMAQVPKIMPEQIECLPETENGVIHTTIQPDIGGVSQRLYFRWSQDEDFYFVLLEAVGQGRYWGVPPKPDAENEMVEYYVALVDPDNQVLAKSDSLMAPVEEECEVELTDQQRGHAENMTVGETTFEQVGEEVDGFLCDGVVNRLNPLGILRGDERCRACVIAWWEKKSVMIPAAAGLIGGGILISKEGSREVSPATPATPPPQQ